MEQNDHIQLFEKQRIRTAWDEEQEEWYFSVVDVVAVLTEQPDTRHASTYWAVLKKRLNEEGAGTENSGLLMWLIPSSSSVGNRVYNVGIDAGGVDIAA